MTDKLENNPIEVADAPQIAGLSFRQFNGEADYPRMAAIHKAGWVAGYHDNLSTVGDMQTSYRHLSNCDPYKDMLFAELNGEMIAYGRVWWDQETESKVYGNFVNIIPKYENQGIEAAMQRWLEARIRIIAHNLDGERSGLLSVEVPQAHQDRCVLLESFGYQPVRYSIEMSRDLMDIPSAELPEGITVRPIVASQLRLAWEISEEAFKEHWGSVELGEEDFLKFKEDRRVKPELWQIAWDGDQIVGQVHNFIDPIENEEKKRLRGYTEEISVVKAYRGKGIARALIVRSMHMMKALNMQEVALEVDTENATGALGLYESLGYKQEKVFVNYRKPIPL